MQRYSRDLRGYGAQPPHPRWPNDAKIAVQIVLNYEEGGENCILHGDEASEAFLSEIVGAAPWPGQRHANMESVYEYGARAGFWRLHRLLTEMSVPVTVYGVATALARSPEQVAAMNDAGWEIASHGLKWIEHKDMTEEEEREQIMAARALHTEVTGRRPHGWYTGRSSANTLRLLSEHADCEYLSDSYADDLPYWLNFGKRDQLVVPYTLDANDMRFATVQGFNTGDHFLTYLMDTFDVLYEEGVAGAPRMMSIGLHCRLAGRPGRALALRRFLEHIREQPGVWIARRIDIARHWAKTHPPVRPGLVPSAMTEKQFVRHFGSVFEHSPWVAKRAFELEIGPAHDCAAGVHSLLCRAFRTASKEDRKKVITAHPDLAGKLASARMLTPESTSEQAAAGLDALTPEEQKTFSILNTQYTKTFGFPFIIAVRDHNKQSILRAFDRRLDNRPAMEFVEACAQVERIALHRLNDMFET